MYKELTIKVYLLKDIHKRNSAERLSEFINYSMNNDEFLAKLHKNKGFKHYCWSDLYFYENMKYEKDNIYFFKMRSRDFELMNRFKKALEKARNENFITLTVEEKIFYDTRIKSLVTITPGLIKIQNKDTGKIRSFVADDGLELAKNSIFKNIEKKINSIGNIILESKCEDVIESLEMKDKYPYIFYYKGCTFIGYKYRITFKENEIAQKYANAFLSEGLGENNSSLGCGFAKIER